MKNRLIKSVLTTVLSIVVIYNGMAQSGKSKNSGGSILFNEVKHDFGAIDEQGGHVQHTFKFVNAGKGPLRIVNVLTSCGCTTSDWTQTAINPKDSGYVTANFDPSNRPGEFSRTLTIITNGTPESVVLTVVGNVESANNAISNMFPSTSGSLKFTNREYNVSVKEDKIDSIWVGVYNPTKKTVMIRSAVSPYAMNVNVKNIMLAPETGENILMLYNGKLVKQLGPKKDTVYLITSDDSVPNKTIIINANIVQNFDKLTDEQKKNVPVIAINKNSGDVGELYLGELGTYTFEITNKGKSDLVIRRLMGADKSITGKAVSTVIKKGAKGKIMVTLNSKDLHGTIEKSLTIITNDPINTFTVVKVSAKVVIPGIEPINK